MLEKIEEVVEFVKTLSLSKSIKIISHNDTDGITSAAIMSKALKRSNIKFSLEIIKNLEKSYIKNLKEDQVLLFLDLGSGSIDQFKDKNTEIIILDHHELPSSLDLESLPKNIKIVNPNIDKTENLTASALSYIFAKNLSTKNTDLATLAIIGIVGDKQEKNLNKFYNEILKDAQVTPRKGLLLYPATRPLDRVLENSYSLYIPGVTGSYTDVIKLLREANIEKTKKGFKSISELTEKEMSDLTNSIILKKHGTSYNEDALLGNLFLIKFLNSQEDAREISATINACSRMGFPEIALGLCLGNKSLKDEANKIYSKYKKTISSALAEIKNMETIKGKDFIIINAKNAIKDTIVGTITSIMSYSPLYEKNTIIITLAYSKNVNNEKIIKVSGRISGIQSGSRNIREIFEKVTSEFPQESIELGGHPNAAGCLIPLNKETEFIENLKKHLEIELVKV